jgi:aryl-alcohol dehydrogenase-like predicted oxidoreductase
VEDFNLGLHLFGEAVGHGGSRWLRRWDVGENAVVVERVRRVAERRGATAREVCLAWVLGQPFAVVGIVGLPSLLAYEREYERGSRLELSGEKEFLAGG